METDEDLLSIVLSMDLDFWGTDKKHRFTDMKDETPVIEGGLSTWEVDRLIQDGWELNEASEDIPEWPVGFGTDRPGEIEIKWGPIPKGTEFLKNPVIDEQLIRY